MTGSTVRLFPGGAPDPAGTPEALASRLAREMAERWAKGEQPAAEEFFARHPDLRHHKEAALRLVYEEICLRRERANQESSAHLVERFPQWQTDLAWLLECHSLLGPRPPSGCRPMMGAIVGGFRLLAELGRGGQGRVYLAMELGLAERPVVLKLTPRLGQEHLTLARLQHTHIVPLYSFQDDPAHDQRLLCMPYLGGTSLANLLLHLKTVPPGQRSGRDLVLALDLVQADGPVTLPIRGRAREWLAAAGYEEAICWIGACLAEALQYAHERNLVHLDLTPGNVLLSAEGQPLLLDFHLARQPIRSGGLRPDWLGGTPGYMPPEQMRAFVALKAGEPVPCPVDERSDIYALALVLYEALGGSIPGDGSPPLPLRQAQPQVSLGLSDVLACCLAPAPEQRYSSAAALASDLRRHLARQPLRGVRNRSWVERWRKWRHRRPHALLLGCTVVALLSALFLTGYHLQRQSEEARTALGAGQVLLERGQYEDALPHLQRGQQLASTLPFAGDLMARFDEPLQRVQAGRLLQQQKEVAARLHEVVERLRFLAAAQQLPPAEATSLQTTCARLWASRSRLAGARLQLSPVLADQVRVDLMDLAVIWTSLRLREVGPGQRAEQLRVALTILAEARTLGGASAVLEWEIQRHELALQGITAPLPPAAAHTAWESLFLGHALLNAGQPEQARQILGRALDLEPQNFWAHYFSGVAARRLRDYPAAVQSFTVCLALVPRSAACYANRALALSEQGATSAAQRDRARAVELDPSLAHLLLTAASLRKP